MTRNKSISELSDSEIDDLLLSLFEGATKAMPTKQELDVKQMSDGDLRRLRSQNHPDKSNAANLKIYKEALQEISLRRSLRKSTG